ncbi:uncharacterized protein LOC143961705 isoform X4 [Lithobates pipiens]
MRGTEHLEMEPDLLCEDNIYANTCDLDVQRMTKAKAKEIPAARRRKYCVILILGVLLILASLILFILTGVLFRYYKSIREEISQMNDEIIEEEITQLKVNNKIIEEEITQLKVKDKIIEEEITQLKVKDKIIEEEITQLKVNNSGLTQDVSDLQKSVANITDDLNKLKLLIIKGSSNPLCSEGWKRYGLNCYYLSSDSKPWNDSKKECEDREAHLVVINSEEEMNFLRGIANQKSFWIGLTDADGTWRWVDGTPYDITPKFWEQSQPDDWTGHGLGGGEDCAQLKNGDDWNDARCSIKAEYICEKKIF